MIGSEPDGLRNLGWPRLLVTAVAFALAPAVVGALIIGAVALLGPGILGPESLRLEGMATFAMVSPLIVGPVWAVVALGSGALMKIGSFGWLPTALLGVVSFGVLSRTDIGSVSLTFGAISALLYRMALALQRPEAF